MSIIIYFIHVLERLDHCCCYCCTSFNMIETKLLSCTTTNKPFYQPTATSLNKIHPT